MGNRTHILRTENVLFRDCILRNTNFVEVIVLYAGNETKTIMNNCERKHKRSKLELSLNRDIKWCIAILAIICIFTALGHRLWLGSLQAAELVPFLYLNSYNADIQSTLMFFTSIILLQAIIPLPLYVTIELVKLVQILHLRMDSFFRDTNFNKTIKINDFSILEDLGQIQFVFSDKTGTLTENKMEFRRATVGALDYAEKDGEGVEMPSSSGEHGQEQFQGPFPLHEVMSKAARASKRIKSSSAGTNSGPEHNHALLKEFFFLLAVCNTTVVSDNKNTEKHIVMVNAEAKNTTAKPAKSKKRGGSNEPAADHGSLLAVPHILPFIPEPPAVALPDTEQGDVVSRGAQPASGNQFKTDGSGGDRNLSYFGIGPVPTPTSNASSFLSTTNRTHDNDADDDDDETASVVSSSHQKISSNTGLHAPQNRPHHNHHHQHRNSRIKENSTTTINSASSVSAISVSSSRGLNKFRGLSHSHRPPYTDEQLRMFYESESPDENALVVAACRYGYKLLQRGPDFVCVWDIDRERPVEYDVLYVLPFDSTRKRMSIVLADVETPRTCVWLYCKGADSAVMSRLAAANDPVCVHAAHENIQLYSKLGLRTLVMTKRRLSLEQYKQWIVSLSKAESENLGGDLDVIRRPFFDELEDDLTLVGATGIEDRLQELVPETLEDMREAGMVVWILTGDKTETGINISYASRLFTEKQRIMHLNGRTRQQTAAQLCTHLKAIQQQYYDYQSFLQETDFRRVLNQMTRRDDLGLCIEGHCIDTLLATGNTIHSTSSGEAGGGHTILSQIETEELTQLQETFMIVASQCASVICCRCTPAQKAAIVQMVREKLRVHTLAVGDGANDVSMIQTAHVGVGLGGMEGMQAVLASDFAVTRFHHLKRLLLVHGHWSYDKLARMSLFMFYKDAMIVLIAFWYQMFCGYTATTPVDMFTMMNYHVIMTGPLPILMGLWDNDFDSETLMKNPQLYRIGIHMKSYRPHYFWREITDAVFQSLVIFFIMYGVYVGSEIGLQEFQLTCGTTVMLVNLFHFGIETKYWSIVHILGLPIFLFVNWIAFMFLYRFICDRAPDCLHDQPDDYLLVFLSRSINYVVICVGTLGAIFGRFFLKSIFNTTRHSIKHEARRRYQNKGFEKASYLGKFKYKDMDVSNPASIAGIKKSLNFIERCYNKFIRFLWKPDQIPISGAATDQLDTFRDPSSSKNATKL